MLPDLVPDLVPDLLDFLAVLLQQGIIWESAHACSAGCERQQQRCGCMLK